MRANMHLSLVVFAETKHKKTRWTDKEVNKMDCVLQVFGVGIHTGSVRLHRQIQTRAAYVVTVAIQKNLTERIKSCFLTRRFRH